MGLPEHKIKERLFELLPPMGEIGNEDFKSAIGLMTEGQLGAGAQLLAKVREEYPHEEYPYYGKIFLACLCINKEEAYKSVDALLEISPGEADYWVAKGWICFCFKEKQQAVDSLQKALQLNPDNKNARKILERTSHPSDDDLIIAYEADAKRIKSTKTKEGHWEKKRLRNALLAIAGGALLLGCILVFAFRESAFTSKKPIPVPPTVTAEVTSKSASQEIFPEQNPPLATSSATWKIEIKKMFSDQNVPLLPDLAELVEILESPGGEGVPLSRQEFITILSRPEAQTVYRDEVIKFATPVSLAIQKREHEDYTKIFMREKWQKAGLEFLRNQSETLELAERRYGVLPRDIVSILVWESGLGKYTGALQEFSVFLGQILFLDLAQKTAVDKIISEGKPNPLADSTFAKKEQVRLLKRKKSAINNLGTLLRICKKEGFDPFDMKGSWGGAIGSVQFMPVNLKYAVDGDGDGRVALSEWPDAIMSVANYLKTLGKYDSTNIGRHRALLRYNPSKEYASGVMLLADAIWKRQLNGE